MKGFQITFFAEQEHRHDHTPMGDWLLQFAKDNGALGGSLMGAATGFGSAGKMHSTHFFELAQQPVAVTVSATEKVAERLLAAIALEPVTVFYIQVPMVYGRIGKATPPALAGDATDAGD